MLTTLDGTFLVLMKINDGIVAFELIYGIMDSKIRHEKYYSWKKHM